MMHFAHHQRQLRSLARLGIKRQSAGLSLSPRFEDKNKDSGEQDGIRNVGRGIEEEGVGVLKKEKRMAGPQSHYPEKEIALGEWHPEIQRHSRRRGEQAGQEVSRVENAPDHSL